MNIVAIVRLIVDKNGDSLLSKQKSPLKQIEQYYYRFEVLQATQFQRKLNNSKKARQLPGNCLLRILLIFQKKKNKERKRILPSPLWPAIEFQESLDKLRSSLMQLCYNNFFSKINATANILSYVLSNDNVHHTWKKGRKQFKSKWEIQSYNDYTRRFGKTSWLRKKRGAKIGSLCSYDYEYIQVLTKIMQSMDDEA